MVLRHLVKSSLTSKSSIDLFRFQSICQSLCSLQRLLQRQYSVDGYTCYHNHTTEVTAPLETTQKQRLLQPCVSVKNVFCYRFYHSTSPLMAGHSKWSNIKHIKGAQDKLKGQKASVLAKQLSLVLGKNPETNPKLNFELANLIKMARSNNIPNDVIDRAIERASKLRDPSSLTVFDGRGFSNTGILIECFSLNQKHTLQTLQGVVKKHGFNLHSSALDLFDHKGYIETDLPDDEMASAASDPSNFSLDKYIDIAIETGAEEVSLEQDSDKPYLQFTCAPQDLEKVRSRLENEGLVVSSAERTYVPNLVVPVSKDFLENIDKLTDKLDVNMDVVKYHFNVKPEESS